MRPTKNGLRLMWYSQQKISLNVVAIAVATNKSQPTWTTWNFKGFYTRSSCSKLVQDKHLKSKNKSRKKEAL